jgi:hypothetical protein
VRWIHTTISFTGPDAWSFALWPSDSCLQTLEMRSEPIVEVL